MALADPLPAAPPAPLQVHVVDDEACWRDTLTLGLRALGHTVRAHGDGDALMAGLSSTLPNCVLLDWHLGPERGDTVLARLAERSDCAAVVMSGDGEAETVVAALRAGARDFVVKDRGLAAVARRVAETGAALERAPDVAPERERARAAIETLSERERQVLASVADGQGTKAIAHALDLSPRTVEMHRVRLRRRLGVSSLHEAAGLWRLAGT